MDNNELNQIVKDIKNLDNGLNAVIVPLFKDSINDYRKICTKLVIIIVILIIGLIGVITYSHYLLSKQADKYNDFLSQFEFTSDEYTQDLDAADGSNITNTTINSN